MRVSYLLHAGVTARQLLPEVSDVVVVLLQVLLEVVASECQQRFLHLGVQLRTQTTKPSVKLSMVSENRFSLRCKKKTKKCSYYFVRFCALNRALFRHKQKTIYLFYILSIFPHCSCQAFCRYICDDVFLISGK